MSLESQIADLVSASNALVAAFSGKKNEINAAVAAALAAAPEAARTWYVDQVNGLDTNVGSLSSPLRTIDQACKNTPTFGVCTVQLLSDYVLAANILVSVASLYVVGYGAVRTLSLKYYQTLNSDGITSVTNLGSLQMATQANQVEFRNLAILLPTAAGQNPAPTVSRITGLVRTNGTGNVPPFLGVSFAASTVAMASDFVGAIVGSTVASISFTAIGTSFPSGFGGKYVAGIASGTAPKDTPNVLSNLSTL